MATDEKIQDAESRLYVKSGEDVVLIRPYLGFPAGTEFHALKVYDASSGDFIRWNVKVVEIWQPKDDAFFHRTLPAEHLRPAWRLGYVGVSNINQADRDCSVIAYDGLEALIEYEMPGGRCFMQIWHAVENGYRSVSKKALPNKWRKLLEEQ